MGKKREDIAVSRRSFIKKGAAIGMGTTGLAGLGSQESEEELPAISPRPEAMRPTRPALGRASRQKATSAG